MLTRTGEGCKPVAEDVAVQLWQDLLIDADSADAGGNNDGKVSMEELANAWGTGSVASAAAATKQSVGAEADFVERRAAPVGGLRELAPSAAAARLAHARAARAERFAFKTRKEVRPQESWTGRLWAPGAGVCRGVSMSRTPK